MKMYIVALAWTMPRGSGDELLLVTEDPAEAVGLAVRTDPTDEEEESTVTSLKVYEWTMGAGVTAVLELMPSRHGPPRWRAWAGDLGRWRAAGLPDGGVKGVNDRGEVSA